MAGKTSLYVELVAVVRPPRLRGCAVKELPVPLPVVLRVILLVRIDALIVYCAVQILRTAGDVQHGLETLSL